MERYVGMDVSLKETSICVVYHVNRDQRVQLRIACRKCMDAVSGLENNRLPFCYNYFG